MNRIRFITCLVVVMFMLSLTSIEIMGDPVDLYASTMGEPYNSEIVFSEKLNPTGTPDANRIILNILTRRICDTPPTPTPEGTPTPIVISNGDFEQGSGVGWTEASTSETYPYPIITNNKMFPPCDGAYYAWLGREHETESQVYQRVIVPPSGVLHWQYRIVSGETCGPRYNVGYFGLSTDGSTYFRLQDYDLCHRNSIGHYVEDSVNLSAYSGQAVLLVFGAITDDSVRSNFFLDNIYFSQTGWGNISPSVSPDGYGTILPSRR